MEEAEKIPASRTFRCPLCRPEENFAVNQYCIVCSGAGAVETTLFKQRQPVMAVLLEIRETIQRPFLPGTLNALQEAFQHLCKLIENQAVPVPLEAFALFNDTDRRIALTAFAAQVVASAGKRAAQEAALQRRIIVPGRGR